MSSHGYSDSTYNEYLSDIAKQTIRDRCEFLSDPQIASKLGVPVKIVEGYRRHKLGILKKGLNKTVSQRIHTTLFSAEEELNALVELGYQGVMKSSYIARIKYLLDILEERR